MVSPGMTVTDSTICAAIQSEINNDDLAPTDANRLDALEPDVEVINDHYFDKDKGRYENSVQDFAGYHQGFTRHLLQQTLLQLQEDELKRPQNVLLSRRSRSRRSNASSIVGIWPAGTHHKTRWAVASRSNHSRRRRRTSTCAVVYVNARSASIEDHTLMLMRKRSSSVGRIAVASPASVCSRQTKPGLSSARRLIGSSSATNPAISGGFHRRQHPADVQLGEFEPFHTRTIAPGSARGQLDGDALAGRQTRCPDPAVDR